MGQMPYLSVEMNINDSVHDSIGIAHLSKCARRRAETEWAQSFHHVHHSQEVSLHDVGYCHGV